LIITINAAAATIALPLLQKAEKIAVDKALERRFIPKFSFKWLCRTGIVKFISPEKNAAIAGPKKP